MAVNYTAFIAKVRLRSPENSPPPVPYRDFATRQHLINDSPYSCRYAIILHLIEETTRGGGHKHKHRKEGRKHSRRINHRYRSVTRQRASERGGFQGSRRIWRKKRKQKFERRKEKEGRSLSLSLSTLPPTQPSFLFISLEIAERRTREKWLDLEWSGGKENTRELRVRITEG